MPRNPRYLRRSEYDIILARSDPSSALGVSLRLGLFAGLRIQEISLTTRNDIFRSLYSGMFSVRKEVAKYQKPRTIPVCEPLADSLAAWYNRHGTVNVRFVRLWDDSMRTVQRRFSRFFEENNLECTPHDLRHTFGSVLYAQCHDLSLVQQCLGHSNLKSTVIYTHVDGIVQVLLREAYESFANLPERKNYRDKIDKTHR